MKSTVGRPRVLSNAEVTRILAWHAELMKWKAQRASIPTLRQLARELHVAPATVSAVIARRGQFRQPPPEDLPCELERRHRRFKNLRIKGFV